MGLLIRCWVLLLLLTTAARGAEDPFILVPRPDSHGFLDGKLALRLNHQAVLYRRQPEVSLNKGLRQMTMELDFAIGLLPDGSVPWLDGLEWEFDFLGGADLHNTPVTRIGLKAGFSPLPSGYPTLAVGIYSTPTGADHNATYLTTVFGNSEFDRRLYWCVGGSVGYQEGGGLRSIIGASLLGITYRPIGGLQLTVEYTGIFVEGTLNTSVGYLIGHKVKLYVAAPVNLTVQDSRKHPPNPALGLVWAY
ncbi:MAG: hypothetical protein HN348_08325 [Proteobacteria bacterium]|jgi:hypothetical protein|nr:hypothetical protein [Pseudomonadota bacterium]